MDHLLDGLERTQPRPRPSFSYSKWNSFKACPRRFALQSYGDRSDRELKMQKSLTGRALLVGNALHLAAAMMLRNLRDGLEPDERRARGAAAELVRDTYRGSAAGLHHKHPEMAGMAEHELDKLVDPEEHLLHEMQEEVTLLIDQLVVNDVFVRIRERALDSFDIGFQILAIDTMPREPAMIAGVPVWARVDVLIRHTDDGSPYWVVCDWKSNRRDRPDEWRAQAGVYAVAVARMLDAPADRIAVQMANVATGTVATFEFDGDEIDTIIHEIDEAASDVAAMETKHGRNPMQWPGLPHGSRGCSWCNYRRTCGRED